MGGGEPIDVVQPHNFGTCSGRMGDATDDDVAAAVDAAAGRRRRPGGRCPSTTGRPFSCRAADLLRGPWRATMNAATILGQSKSVLPGRDRRGLRAHRLSGGSTSRSPGSCSPTSPRPAPGMWNRMEYRPLEGFVLAITPFNFTAIAANLPSAPALLGNTVVWKPSPTQQLAAHTRMRLLEAAGLPPGVINMVTGNGQAVSEVALPHRDLAGIHFTGSTATFQHLWATVGSEHRELPQLSAHRRRDRRQGLRVRPPVRRPGRADHRADPRRLRVPGPEVLGGLAQLHPAVAVGGGCATTLAPGRVADRRRRRVRPVAVQGRGHRRAGVRQARAGALDRAADRAVGAGAHRRAATTPRATSSGRPCSSAPTRPTRCSPPSTSGRSSPCTCTTTATYDDHARQAAEVAPYALTGAIIAQDRAAIAEASDALRFAAGNFYINDKPTGAVVGQQPFGGARASGTNDKAGSILNLIRWVSARTIKETFVPPVDYRYPHMG